MRSPRIFTHKGFTLLEILIATAIITMMAGVGLVFSIDAYRGYLFHAERNTAVAVLQKARSRALNNMYQAPHGVRFESSSYILFRGNSYVAGNPSNEDIPKNTNIAISGPAEIVFSQLSGDASPTGDITISDGLRSKVISINNEGRINW